MNRSYDDPLQFDACDTTTYFPSGVKVGDTNPALASRVSGRGSLPSAFTSQRLSPPLRSLTKTIVLPSGEKCGWPSNAWPLVIRVAFPPAIGTVYRSPRMSKTIVWPFGDTSTVSHVPSSVVNL